MERPVPSSLENHLGYWLRCLSNFVSHSFAARLEKCSLSVAQWVVLRTLYDCPGATLNAVATDVGVDKSTLSRMVERLVKKGWIERTGGRDRRSVELSLTSAGKKVVIRSAKCADENDAAFFHTLPPRQRAAFKNTIQQLLADNGWTVTSRGRDRLE